MLLAPIIMIPTLQQFQDTQMIALIGQSLTRNLFLFNMAASTLARMAGLMIMRGSSYQFH
jgi:hypothetical protein